MARKRRQGGLGEITKASSRGSISKFAEELKKVRRANPNLHIKYRTDNCPLYRWDTRDPGDIFKNGGGFMPKDTKKVIPNYYNIYNFVFNSGPILDGNRSLYGFISTTRNPRYVPMSSRNIYRYKIWAPGGICVKNLFQNSNDLTREMRKMLHNQREVTFVGGIDTMYIESAQMYMRARGAFKPMPTGGVHRNRHFIPLKQRKKMHRNNDVDDDIEIVPVDYVTPKPKRSRRKKSRRKRGAENKSDEEFGLSPKRGAENITPKSKRSKRKRGAESKSDEESGVSPKRGAENIPKPKRSKRKRGIESKSDEESGVSPKRGVENITPKPKRSKRKRGAESKTDKSGVNPKKGRKRKNKIKRKVIFTSLKRLLKWCCITKLKKKKKKIHGKC